MKDRKVSKWQTETSDTAELWIFIHNWAQSCQKLRGQYVKMNYYKQGPSKIIDLTFR